MFRPRIIPVLLLKNAGLVKSVKFKNHRYIGDPINAVRIFNDLKADELIFLDIEASKQNRPISEEFVRIVGEEADMPFAVGGGIASLNDIKNLINAGAEKVVINTEAVRNSDFIKEASEKFGTSTIAVCIDVKKTFFGNIKILTNSGTRQHKIHPVKFAQKMEEKGAGEIIIQSIERDGTMQGYDIELIKKVSQTVSIPVVALGGAGSLEDLQTAHTEGFASGLAAGSLFVFQGKKRGVLINYPNRKELGFDKG